MDGRVNLNCNNTLDKMKSILSSWKSKILSLVGKVTLVMTILNSIPTYPMQIFKFPKQLCTEIYKMNLNFIWQGNENNMKIHLVDWNSICRHKKFGRLRVQKVFTINRALLMKFA